MSTYSGGVFDIGTAGQRVIPLSTKYTKMLQACNLDTMLEQCLSRSADIAIFAGMMTSIGVQVGMYFGCQQFGCTYEAAVVQLG